MLLFLKEDLVKVINKKFVIVLMADNNSIIIKGLTKNYGKLTAINNLSLNVKRGEIFGLLGPNGAGKTTLISVLATLLKPSKGKILVDSYDVEKEAKKVRESIGITFQETILDLELDAEKNLDFHGMLYKIPKELRKRKIKEMLDLVGLSEHHKKIVDKFSGGMKRRLEIARGLLHNPKILFLDEPTLGLDPQTRRHIWDYILKLKKKEKITILLTTHYMEEADYLCDRVAIIDKGKIITLGEPKKLKSQLQGDIIKIKLKKFGKRLIEDFKKSNFIEEVKISQNNINLLVKNAESKIVKVVDILKNNETEINEISIHKPTLEDVFLNFTGREMRDDT